MAKQIEDVMRGLGVKLERLSDEDSHSEESVASAQRVQILSGLCAKIYLLQPVLHCYRILGLGPALHPLKRFHWISWNFLFSILAVGGFLFLETHATWVCGTLKDTAFMAMLLVPLRSPRADFIKSFF